MAVIGHLGDIIFEASEKTVLTLSNWQWSGSARYATHQRRLNNALTEFVGIDPDTITFDMVLSVELGVDPMAEVAKIFRYERSGEALSLAVGTHGYGKYRWNIVSHKMKMQAWDKAGDVAHATVSVTLQEYLRG